jgi:hypothetical protein
MLRSLGARLSSSCCVPTPTATLVRSLLTPSNGSSSSSVNGLAGVTGGSVTTTTTRVPYAPLGMTNRSSSMNHYRSMSSSSDIPASAPSASGVAAASSSSTTTTPLTARFPSESVIRAPLTEVEPPQQALSESVLARDLLTRMIPLISEYIAANGGPSPSPVIKSMTPQLLKEQLKPSFPTNGMIYSLCLR